MEKVTITELNMNGLGIAKKDGKVFIVPKTVPNDEIEIANSEEKNPNVFIVKSFNLIKPSEKRTKAPCPFFEKCGGCELQHIPYSLQLKYKQENLVKILKEKADIEPDQINEIIPSEETLWHRNKIRHSFKDIGGKISISRHSPFSSDSNVPITECLLMSKRSNSFCNYICDFANKNSLSVFSKTNPEGILKFITIRESKNNNEFMVILVIANPMPEKMLKQLTEKLVKKYGRMRSFYLAEAKGGQNEIVKQKLIYGRKFIREYINSGKTEKIVTHRFNISPTSFFQTNTKQAEKLFNKVIEMANVQDNEIVFDLYSGTGTMAIMLSKFARKVYSIEEERESIADARQNAKMNACDNISFIKGDALSSASDLARQNIYPNITIVDPPRAGLSKQAMQKLINIFTPRLIYVSCNPITLARDLKILKLNNFEIKEIQPIDMFPQTSQLECIVKLELKLSV